MTPAVKAALGWVGTPYVHRASVRGVGCDCVGLVRGVWRELGGVECDILPPYTPDWAERSGREWLIEGLARRLEPVACEEALAGDVLVFRMQRGAMAKHAGILCEGEGVADRRARFVHAYWGHAVARAWLYPFWVGRIVTAFRFRVG